MAEAQVSLRADTADAVEAFNNFADSAEKSVKAIASGSLADLSEVLTGPAKGVALLGQAFIDVAAQIGKAVSATAKMTGESGTFSNAPVFNAILPASFQHYEFPFDGIQPTTNAVDF